MSTKSMRLVLISLAVIGGVRTAVAQCSGDLELSELDGPAGFPCLGSAAGDLTGRAVAGVGDVNADGIGDFAVGAPEASPHGAASGKAYVVFGDPQLGDSGVLQLSGLFGTKGFEIHGQAAVDQLGCSVAPAGDFNADGVPDILVGALGHRPPGLGHEGGAYLIFGSPSIGAGGFLEASGVGGSNGVLLEGELGSHGAGASLAGAGDLNADGFDDVVIGAPGGGRAYVCFGTSATGAGGPLPLGDLDGADGFRISGMPQQEPIFRNVAGGADADGDGHPDLLIGVPGADPPGKPDAGITYLLRGGPRMGAAGELDVTALSPGEGCAIHGVFGAFGFGDGSGWSVSFPGDVNADGAPDLLIGAPEADPKPPGTPGTPDAGAAYAVFGGGSLGGSTFELAALDGTDGHQIHGGEEDDEAGYDVSGAGDVDGDGIDDFALSARDAELSRGAAYVLYGTSTPVAGGFIELSTLTPQEGFKILGASTPDRLAALALAGDADADGKADLLLGAVGVGGFGGANAGSAYLVRGSWFPTTLTADTYTLVLHKGGVQSLCLDAGETHAGRVYWVIGSLSGTSPGFDFGSVHVPLNPDAYLGFTIAHPNQAPLYNAVGVLDGAGRAQAQFVIPPFTSSALSGAKVHHVYGLVDGAVDFVSHPQHVNLQ
jgi:hypothetical protein